MRPPSHPLARALTGAALALAFLVAGAGPAAAHAVLLRTDPSPQSTVKTPPAAVHLVFSEPVEVAFGAVRVFDVDGKRVDKGKITTADGRREVVVPAGLPGGTYTVTWRVVSADGHPVHGGFQFYVGAPSTISPVLVKGDSGAGRVVGWGYGTVRFVWYGALLAVVGLVAVRRSVWTPAVRAAGLGDSAAADRFRRRFSRALPGAWAVLLVAWLVLLVFQAASISGLGLLRSARPSVLRDVLRTGFGRSWLAGLGFTVLVGLPVAGLTRRKGLFGARPETWLSVMAAAAAGLVLSVADIGHAATESHPRLGVPSVAVHLLAVSVWVGGLGGLVVVGASAWTALPPGDRGALLRQLVPRFSRLALVAVGVLVATGIVNAVLDLARVSDLWDTTYGRVLSAKILLLIVALAFGAWHFRVVPRRLAEPDRALAAGRSFRLSSGAELVVLAAVVAFASALVALVPGRSLALLAKGAVNQEQKAGAYTVQLFVDPSAPGANEVHVTFVDANGLGAAEVVAVTATLTGPAGGPGAPVEMRLISPGHFVGDASLAAGQYRLAVQAPRVAPPAATAFSFKLRAGRGAGG
ncbi:MAG TPA: copper resistance protein CopC [Acidimicrobiia bacterium]|nr:copper resistance protein CopC [Acidimicrobiia bacterium]